jgi:tRNA G18 (ribose-2'-O)-methylase SpoU
MPSFRPIDPDDRERLVMLEDRDEGAGDCPQDRVLTKPELRESKPGRGDFAGQARNPITVVLDRVDGLYNIGALFRLCDALLVERLIICGEESVPALLRKRKLVQAAMGTHRWVPWQQEKDAVEVVRAAKAAGAWIAAAELTVESVPVTAMRPRFPALLVLGNERSGVSEGVLAYADQAVAIPMLGLANSLNVATAAAIVLYEMERRCGHQVTPPHG